MSGRREDDVRTKLFLHEMGLGPVWTLRKLPEAGQSIEVPVVHEETAQRGEKGARFEPNSSMPQVEEAGTLPWAEIMPTEHRRPHGHDERYAPARIASMDWAALRDTVSGCVKCRLCEGRTKTVFGTGDEKATWLFIGEGPGRNEDQQGEPFIGPAGRLLDNMLRALGVQRGDNAYIANVVKCRPTDSGGRDRPPAPDEAAACLPYLQRQIALINPTVLVALGKTAAISLLGLDPDTPVGSLRGKVHRYGELPLVVTYHPAYLLRRLQDKGKVWRDLCLAAEAHQGQQAASAGA